ncbi:hypothetical protein STEG23_020055, partial [Scotinomys teguina]
CVSFVPGQSGAAFHLPALANSMAQAELLDFTHQMLLLIGCGCSKHLHGMRSRTPE